MTAAYLTEDELAELEANSCSPEEADRRSARAAVERARMLAGPLPKGRAVTPEQKRLVVEQLLAAWLMAPEQRLGQLIDNALDRDQAPLFFVEDRDLVAKVEGLALEFLCLADAAASRGGKP